MASTHLEVERSFSPRVDTPVPPLVGLLGVATAEPAGEERLDATYHDTAELTLLRAGVSLRRRLGGADTGWHLKLPTSRVGAREEVHLPVGDPDLVPAELLDLVAGWTRGAEVGPVARIRTRRTTTRLVGEGGAVLAELADDLVEGQRLVEGEQPTYWREWELELVEGSGELLENAEALFGDHGVGPSAVQRKVETVLGVPSRVVPKRPLPKRAARLAVHARLVRQVRRLEELDPVVRLGRPEGVHGMRKACRRLRTVLAAYRPLLQRELTDPVRDELGWLARALGGARDEHVVLGRLSAAVEREPADLVLGDPHARLRAAASEQTDAVLGSERYRALRTALVALVAAPPWTSLAEEPARDVLPRLLANETRRVRRAHRDAEDPHELRKAAKRLRYAYEVVEPLWPSARKPRRAAARLAEVLGDHQDGVVARARLVKLADGSEAFTWGRLHALEDAAEPGTRREAEREWRRLRKLSW